MKTSMNAARACPNCGKPLPAGALAGLCPACLMAQGTETDTGEPKTPCFEPLPLDQVAKLFPQLEILSFLGAGGMGAVYKARQPALDRQVALKLLPPHDTTRGGNFEDRFNREARALARLSHPNIVTVHEFGETNGHRYFLMEFVDGANLRQLEQAGRLSPREALQIIPQICDALQYAHDEGVVHRDIKPENVLVDRKGRVKIADFGLAKILGQDPESLRLTAEGQIMGTPHYMAPEQVERPLTVDHRADIYSLGVVFYEMLTGDLPLGNFSPPSRKVQVDVRFDDIVLRALENNPSRRYQKASEVKSQVENIAATPTSDSSPASASPAQYGHWFGFSVVVEENGKRRIHWNGTLQMLAVAFGLLTIAFAFVSATTGRSIFGMIGIIGWPSVVARIVLATLLVGWGVNRAMRRPTLAGSQRTPNGTVILFRPQRWRGRSAAIWTSLVLLLVTWTLFQKHWLEDRFREVRLRLATRVEGVAQRDAKTGALAVDVSDHATLEVIALANSGAGPNQWWHPDGRLIEDQFIEVMGLGEVEDSVPTRKIDLILRAENLPNWPVDASFVLDPPSTFGGGGDAFQNGDKIQNGFPLRVAFPATAKHAMLRAGLTWDPWVTISRYDPSQQSTTQIRHRGAPRWQAFVHWVSDNAGSAQITLVLGAEDRNWRTRIVALDTNNVIHSNSRGSGTPAGATETWTYTFRNLSLSAIQEFQVQVRPVHWFEFPDIVLQPNKPLPAAAPVVFASAKEITFDGVIDFDNGRTASYPTRTNDNPLVGIGDNVQWMIENGFDAETSADELHPVGMDFVAVNNSAWETLTAEETIHQLYSGSLFRPRALKPSEDGKLPATFIFRTREHGIGLLQLVSFGGTAPRATVRIKPILHGRRSPHQTTTPPLTAERLAAKPAFRFLAWQDQEFNLAATWHPDGTPVTAEEKPLIKVARPTLCDVSGTSVAKSIPRFLHLWFAHELFDRQSLVKVTLSDENNHPLQPSAGGTMASNAQTADERTGGFGWLTITLSPGEGDAIPTNINVQLDYAIGPLERTRKVSPDFRGGMSLEGGSQLNGIGQDSKGKAFVTLAVDSVSLGSRQFGVLAVTKDGRELPQSGGGTSGVSGSALRVISFEFDLPLHEVEQFIIGTRPVHTVQWKDVTLPPLNP